LSFSGLTGAGEAIDKAAMNSSYRRKPVSSGATADLVLDSGLRRNDGDGATQAVKQAYHVELQL
jgi:hypothetical protein